MPDKEAILQLWDKKHNLNEKEILLLCRRLAMDRNAWLLVIVFAISQVLELVNLFDDDN